MEIEAIRDMVHSLIVALSVVQAALLAIEKLLQANNTISKKRSGD